MNKKAIAMEIAERVMNINFNRGTKLHLEINQTFLNVFDENNGCKNIVPDSPGYLYFDEFWENRFLEIAEKFNLALDKYEEGKR